MAAFMASTVSLQQGLAQSMNIALQEKNYLQTWSAKLSGNITALDAVTWVANLNNVIAQFNTIAALPGLAAYAQAQVGSGTYDIVAAFNTMVAALTAILNWLKTNIPSNAITITNGLEVGAVYAPATTASLKTLVDAAIATIA